MSKSLRFEFTSTTSFYTKWHFTQLLLQRRGVKNVTEKREYGRKFYLLDCAEDDVQKLMSFFRDNSEISDVEVCSSASGSTTDPSGWTTDPSH